MNLRKLFIEMQCGNYSIIMNVKISKLANVPIFGSTLHNISTFTNLLIC